MLEVDESDEKDENIENNSGEKNDMKPCHAQSEIIIEDKAGKK